MTADVNQDRRVTGVIHGITLPVLSDGSRLFWAFASPVHEELGYGPSCPTGYKVMRCFPHSSFTAQSRITSRRSRSQSSRSSSLAPCSPSSRRGLAKAELAASAERRPALTMAARGAAAGSRSGRRNTLGRTKKLLRLPNRVHRHACLLTPSLIQGWVSPKGVTHQFSFRGDMVGYAFG